MRSIALLLAVLSALCACPTAPHLAPWVSETHLIDLDVDTLASRPTISLGAPGNPLITGIQTRVVRRGPDDFTWFGRTADDGAVIITRKQASVYGVITIGTTAYELTRRLDGRLQLDRFDRTKLAPVHRREQYKFGDRPPVMPVDAPVEVLVVYTEAAERACSNTKSRAEAAVSAATEISSASGIDVVFHLAAVKKDTSHFREGNDLETDVSAFAAAGDETLEDVHTWREQFHADIAILLVKQPNESAVQGWAQEQMARPDHAFAGVDCTSAVINFSLAHEIGHLMGLQHDVADDSATGSYPYAHGFVHLDEPVAGTQRGWSTVMAVAPNCCPRIPRWSTPNKTFQDVKTGDSTADNAETLRRTAGAVSRYRSGHP
jgi:peptidyl-Asp metalloendopeptidase